MRNLEWFIKKCKYDSKAPNGPDKFLIPIDLWDEARKHEWYENDGVISAKTLTGNTTRTQEIVYLPEYNLITEHIIEE